MKIRVKSHFPLIQPPVEPLYGARNLFLFIIQFVLYNLSSWTSGKFFQLPPESLARKCLSTPEMTLPVQIQNYGAEMEA